MGILNRKKKLFENTPKREFRQEWKQQWFLFTVYGIQKELDNNMAIGESTETSNLISMFFHKNDHIFVTSWSTLIFFYMF